jgi:hypothetical protein
MRLKPFLWPRLGLALCLASAMSLTTRELSHHTG